MQSFSLKKRSHKNPSNLAPFPSLPTELWISIIHQALLPSIILDKYCFSSNMEYFYCTVIDERGGGYLSRENEAAKTTRMSLRKVNRLFKSIVDSIPKKPNGLWAIEADNEPRNHRAPVPRWEYPWDHSTRNDRFDLKMDYEETTRVVVRDSTPVSTFRLFLFRKNAGPDTLAFVRSTAEILWKPEALRVIHLFLDFCVIRSPRDFTETLETKASQLTTLSLTFSSSNDTIKIIYEKLELDHVRTLFLKFHAYGANDNALEAWNFPSLTVLSLDLRITRYGMSPVKAVPLFAARFLDKCSKQLYGLRLLPGLWPTYFISEIQGLSRDEQEGFWRPFLVLETLSCDFSSFPEASTVLPASLSQILSKIRNLGQVRDGRPSDFAQGLINVIEVCPILETVIIRRNSTEFIIDESMWQENDHLAFGKLRIVCNERNIKLLNVLGASM